MRVHQHEFILTRTILVSSENHRAPLFFRWSIHIIDVVTSWRKAVFLRLNIPHDDDAMTIQKRSRRGWRYLVRVTWVAHLWYAPTLFLSVPLDGSEHTAVTFCFSRFSFSSCLLLCSFRRCTLLLPKARGTEYAHVPGTIDELTANWHLLFFSPDLIFFFSSSFFTCFRILRRSLWIRDSYTKSNIISRNFEFLL